MKTNNNLFSFLFFGFFLGLLPTLLAMDPDADETPDATPASTMPAHTTPIPTASAAPHTSDTQAMCEILGETSLRFKTADIHIMPKTLEELTCFLDKADAGDDPFVNVSSQCCNALTISKIISKLVEPGQDALCERLTAYCKRTQRNLHASVVFTFVPKQEQPQLYALLCRLPITHLNLTDDKTRELKELAGLKDTIRSLKLSAPRLKKIDVIGTFEHLEALEVMSVCLSNPTSLNQCQKLHTAYFVLCGGVKDPKFLSTHPCLKRLAFFKCGIKHTEDFLSFPTLEHLVLHENPHLDKEHLPALRERFASLSFKEGTPTGRWRP